MHFRKLLTLAAVAVFATAGVQEAYAQRSYFKSAPSGKSQWIDAYMGWNDDCSHKVIDVDIAQGPSHGRVTPRIETKKIAAAQIGSSGSCRGKPVRAVSVYYKSKNGYRGMDKFKIRMRVGNSAPVTFTYRVRVN